MGPSGVFLARFDLCGGAREAAGGFFAAREIELVALDLFLLAIHEIDVVAEEQAQVVHAFARHLDFDGIEAEQEIETEGSDEREPRGQRMLNSAIRARMTENAEGCLLRSSSGEESGQRLERSAQGAFAVLRHETE